MTAQHYSLGLLGFPLGHSLSPIIHNYLLNFYELKGSYKLLETAPEALEPYLKTFLDKDNNQKPTGLNVTVPHKVVVANWLSSLPKANGQNRLVGEALATGSVNTLYWQANELLGASTDGRGYYNSLPASLQEALPTTPVTFIGAGGSCRALLYALIMAKVPTITLFVRDKKRANDTLEMAYRLCDAQAPRPKLYVELLEDDYACRKRLEATGLLINTSPVGMWPKMDSSPLSPDWLESLPHEATVSDLIYRPQQTAFLKQAQTLGLKSLGGLGMLIHQALLSFELWTGQPVEPAIVLPLTQQLEAKLQEALAT